MITVIRYNWYVLGSKEVTYTRSNLPVLHLTYMNRSDWNFDE